MNSLVPIRALTSSSKLAQRRDCPGSANLERGLAEETSEYSEEGSLLHSLLLTGSRPAVLTVEQRDVLGMADFYTNEFFNRVRTLAKIPMEAEYFDEREVGMVLRGSSGEIIMPGHADVIRHWPGYPVRAIADAKFGFSEVESAPDNLQLASYAAMRQQQMGGLGDIYVAIIQPRNFGPRWSWARYTAEQLPDVALSIVDIEFATHDPAAPRVAGPSQCQFCKAKTICPEFKKTFMAVERASQRAVSTLSDEELGSVFNGIQFANKIADSVRDEMRRRIEQGGMPGFKLQNSGDDVEVLDRGGLFKAFRAYFQDPPGFALAWDNCQDVSWGRLCNLVQTLTGLSEKKAKELIKELSKGHTKRTPKTLKVMRDKSNPNPLAIEG